MARILFVTDVFPPSIGGPATFFDYLGHALTNQGHAVTVVCSSERPTDPSDKQRPFRVIRFYASNRLMRQLKTRLVLALEMPRHTTALINGLEHPTAQVASLCGCRYILRIAGDYVWEAARNAGLTPLSFDDFQSADVTDPVLRRIARERQQYISQARLIVTPSQHLRRTIIGWGVIERQIRVVPNGLPLEDYMAFRPARRSTQTLRVAFCGRLTNWKGVETLLLAIQDLTDVTLSIIGDGPEWPMLVGLAQQLHLTDRVQFLGRLAREPMQAALSRMDVLVLDSLYEGLSHTLLEAGAMGLACVASQCGGNPEIIEPGINGLLVPYGDVVQLRAALERLRDDEDLRYRLACNAKEASQRFDFRNTVQQASQLLFSS